MSKVIIEKLNEQELKNRGVFNWPVWEKEKSKFDWYYDSDEECYIIEGEVVVETDKGEYILKPGDFVTFKKGLECVWNIKSDVKKHYNFP